MAGKDNLKPQNTRTKAEQREIARKGGVKSGQVRRERKLLSQIYAKVIDDEADTIEQAIKKKIQKGDVSFLPEMGKLTEGNKVQLSGNTEMPIQIVINPIEKK